MLVHFMAVVDGNRDQYSHIIDIVKNQNHSLVTDHYLKRTIQEIEKETEVESYAYTKNFQNWIKKSDIVIFEVTKSDINTGIELSFAVSEMKPVIVLFKEETGKAPYSLKGVKNETIQIVPYSESNLEFELLSALNLSESQLSTRFNLILPAKQSALLSSIAKSKKTTKSAVVRQLIDKLEDQLKV